MGPSKELPCIDARAELELEVVVVLPPAAAPRIAIELLAGAPRSGDDPLKPPARTFVPPRDLQPLEEVGHGFEPGEPGEPDEVEPDERRSRLLSIFVWTSGCCASALTSGTIFGWSPLV